MQTRSIDILAFDVGKRMAAWALAREGRIIGCGLVRWNDGVYPRELGPAPEPVRAIIELPQVRTRGRGRTPRASDIVACAITCGRVAQALGPKATIEMVDPHDWKHSVDADVMLGRIESKLDQAERVILQRVQRSGVPASLMHNVIDAVGIALWGSGRLH